MTSPFLQADIAVEEGLRLVAYPDPLSRGAPWTIGYGHTGKDVHPGLSISKMEAQALLASDIHSAIIAVRNSLPWWVGLSDLRQDVVVDMAFNLGMETLLTFHRTLSAIQHSQWEEASKAMLSSTWAGQVGRRADRLAEQIRTGAHVPY